MTRRIPLPHPGELLREEFLEPMELSVYALAKAIGLPRSRVNSLCRGEQGVTASLALRLGKYFGVDPRWFMNMQTQYDLALEGERLADKIAAITPGGGVAAVFRNGSSIGSLAARRVGSRPQMADLARC